ncbi:M12 family metallopeptidase [Nocardia sp. NPDC057663]|uniref:M12 family metallopeptidase n=1 Tax=Nocardia sp. NPDC057663 TaxID=3346201 RepID=UPI00366D5B60
MAYGVKNRLWKTATIPYEINSDDFPPGSQMRVVIDQAIDHWNSRTVMRFVPRANETDYVVFDDHGSCFSEIGRVGGRQSISCTANNSAGNIGGLLHEMGHAVGFIHEHQRPDRSSHVTVGASTDGNCTIANGGWFLTDYDCESVMHYPLPTDCGGMTPKAGCTLKPRQRLSGRDVWGASVLYIFPLEAVVVWEDDSDGNGLFEIHAAGTAAPHGRQYFGPITVNQSARGQQKTPEVGMGGFGEMVFVWADDTDGNGFYQIVMKAFGHGRQTISERTVNVDSTGQQVNPHVAVAGKSIVVVWQDDSDSAGSYRIKVRGFDSSGNQTIPQRTVSTFITRQTKPRVAAAADGSFVVVWESDPDGNGNADLRMAGFGSDGTTRWGEKTVHKGGAGGQHRQAQIAMRPTGDFAVVWADDTDGNGHYQIHMRGFKADGSQQFPETAVNLNAAGQQIEPDIAVNDSRVVVVWADDADRNGKFEIMMRGFNWTGVERLAETTVNTDSTGQQRRPRIGIDQTRNITVAWTDDPESDGSTDILVRGLDLKGAERFATRHVAGIPGRRHSRPSIASWGF